MRVAFTYEELHLFAGSYFAMPGLTGMFKGKNIATSQKRRAAEANFANEWVSDLTWLDLTSTRWCKRRSSIHESNVVLKRLVGGKDKRQLNV